ncbi:MAG: polysaccharide deacetylase family protein [Lachnospiraceae bacterium]|nr:polysaccharide deacetylase family protein [Lachnospiraceae bacterium]
MIFARLAAYAVEKAKQGSGMFQNGNEVVFWKKAAVAVLFIAAFFTGRLAAYLTAGEPSAGRQSSEAAGKITGDGDVSESAGEGTDVTLSENAGTAVLESTVLSAEATENWGLSFQEEGKTPVANATEEELAQVDAYFVGDTEEKVIYLTFDCGYENGNTPAILSALNKHGVSATFFVVGNFVEDNPGLVNQMLAEGHTVGNHTAHHPDMSAIADMESFQAEIEELEKLFYEATGQEISNYYRPPQGKYSQSNLLMAQELGYQTFFWSLAYVDWYQDDQPTEEEAFEKLLGRIHPGAVVLLHNTSSTNAAILDELLTRWEEMGYRFGTLEELTQADESA